MGYLVIPSALIHCFLLDKQGRIAFGSFLCTAGGWELWAGGKKRLGCAGDALYSGPGVHSCCSRVERANPALERGTGAVEILLQGWGAVGWVEAKGQLKPARSSPSVSQIQPLWQH